MAEEDEEMLDFRAFTRLHTLKVHLAYVAWAKRLCVKPPVQVEKLWLVAATLSIEDCRLLNVVEELRYPGVDTEMWNIITKNNRKLKWLSTCLLTAGPPPGGLACIPSLLDCTVSDLPSAELLNAFRTATPQLRRLSLSRAHFHHDKTQKQNCWRDLTSLQLLSCWRLQQGKADNLLGEVVRGAVLRRLVTDDQSCDPEQVATHCFGLRFCTYGLTRHYDADWTCFAELKELVRLDLWHQFAQTRSQTLAGQARLVAFRDALFRAHGEEKALRICSSNLRQAFAAVSRRTSLRSSVKEMQK